MFDTSITARILQVVVAAAILLLPGQVQAQNRPNLPQADVNAINDAVQALAKAIRAAEWKAVGALYAEEVEDSGYFLEVRRKQNDGRWLIVVHMLVHHESAR